jgi:hypothetical protein
MIPYTPMIKQGDQIWAIFCQLGYFWKLIMIFWKDAIAPKYGNIFGYFLLKQMLYIFP